MYFKDIFKIKYFKVQVENLKVSLQQEIIKRKQDFQLYNREIQQLKFIYIINKKIALEYKENVKTLQCQLNKEELRIKGYQQKANGLKITNTKCNEVLEKEKFINILRKQLVKKYNEENNKLKLEFQKYIINLKKENDEMSTLIEEYKYKIYEFKIKNNKLNEMLNDDCYRAENIKEFMKKLENDKKQLEKIISDKNSEKTIIEEKIKGLKEKVIELNDEVLYQSFSLYKPVYEFHKSAEYKNKLDSVRSQQKEMLKLNKAAVCNANWMLNGSRSQGICMTKNNIKQILRSFNSECDNVIGRVKFNNYGSMEKRIINAFNSLNNINKKNSIELVQGYLKLKIEELKLAYEYTIKRKEEKEERKKMLEEKREEAKLLKEIEERKRELEKEKMHYDNVMNHIEDQIKNEKNEERLKILLHKKNNIKNNLGDIDKALREVDYREANCKAGYVYVISNIGAFGEDVYKIGMTRRLEPQDRIDELGSASVPFKFDVHAMIFSDDAPKLESAIHRAFEDKKINAINGRKEFFKVTLQEIEAVVKQNYDNTVNFVKVPEAQQYRESLKLKEKIRQRIS